MQIKITSHDYGSAESQQGALYLPTGNAPAPVIVLFHGGFWRYPHGREQLHDLALHLAESGWAVWNLSYRRVGEIGGGWPGTGEDVLAGLFHLSALQQQGTPIDLDRVVIFGHSAGGQLALWVAKQHAKLAENRIKLAGVVAAAPVSDLVLARKLQLGNGAVDVFFEHDDSVVRRVSPYHMLPLGIPHVLLHGQLDAAIPVEMSSKYVEAAKISGDDAQLRILQDADHMAFIDPTSYATSRVRKWIADLFVEPISTNT